MTVESHRRTSPAESLAHPSAPIYAVESGPVDLARRPGEAARS